MSNKIHAGSISASTKEQELRLGIDIEDIIDELYMLKQLFETQVSVFKEGVDRITSLERLRHLKDLHDTMQGLAYKVSTEYLSQVQRMISESERLRKSLFNLLDLQQREENIREAKTANQQALFAGKQALSGHDQAAAAEAQSSVLFMFTVVTIVFLPLSFFASFFGMFDVNDKAGGKISYSDSYVKKAMWCFSGPFYALALCIAGGYYFFHIKKARWEWARELQDWKDEGHIPKGLIDKRSALYRRMEALRLEKIEKGKPER